MLGPNSVVNANCDQAAVLHDRQWSSDSRFAFTGDGQFATLQSVFNDGPGDYLVVVVYWSANAWRLRAGDGGNQSVPAASEGGAFSTVVTMNDPAGFPAIQFNDLEDTPGQILHVEVRKVTS